MVNYGDNIQDSQSNIVSYSDDLHNIDITHETEELGNSIYTENSNSFITTQSDLHDISEQYEPFGEYNYDMQQSEDRQYENDNDKYDIENNGDVSNINESQSDNYDSQMNDDLLISEREREKKSKKELEEEEREKMQ